MPAKYAHVKKRPSPGKKSNGTHLSKDGHHFRSSNPHVDRSISQAMTAVSQLERAIARILLIRYEQDIARLFSTRIYSVALVHLPTFIMRCISVAGPSWLAHNYDCDDIKDFFRAAISMDMRQAGERVATKSVLWSYTALRHFAMSNNVPICNKRGLHSLRLLPYFPALKTHLDALESMPPASFSKPPHLGSLQDGQDALEDACELKYARAYEKAGHPEWDAAWRLKVRFAYERLAQTLWRVAREYDVRGYGMVLREKLTTKWCDCGCSTDHLGEVCERTVREEEEESGVRLGKQREWDGRGSGVYKWETEEEEDIWEVDLDFGGLDPDECEGGIDSEMTIGEMMEWRYLKAEREKEEGNVAFRQGNFETAVKHYMAAHEIEPELPHYQLNLAAAHLKLNNWMEAERACTKALGQHRSSKGYYRRARARRMLDRPEEAIKDLRSVLRLQPTNTEAIAELVSLLPPERARPPSSSPPTSAFPPTPSSSSSTFPATSSSSSSSSIQHPHPPSSSADDADILHRLGIPRPKHLKPPPFPRTSVDCRKLKIAFMPTSVAELTSQAHRHAHGAACGHPMHVHHAANTKGKGNTSAHPKAQARQGKAREMAGIAADTVVVYPGWERYIVRRKDL